MAAISGEPIDRRPGRVNVQLRILDLPVDRLAASPALTPFLKWPGGKSQELTAIAAAAPPLEGRFIDPFVGGGSVLLAVPDAVEAWANDAAEDLIELYRAAADERWSFRDAVHGIAGAWEALRSCSELYRALAEDFLSGSRGATVVRTGLHARSLDRVVALAGPELEDVFTARLARDLPPKFDRMRKIQAALGRTPQPRGLAGQCRGRGSRRLLHVDPGPVQPCPTVADMERDPSRRLLLPPRVRLRRDVPFQLTRRVQRPIWRSHLQPQVAGRQGECPLRRGPAGAAAEHHVALRGLRAVPRRGEPRFVRLPVHRPAL